MIKSLIFKENCKVCGKLAEEKSRLKLGSSLLITLQCGHVTTEEVIKSADYSSIESSDGRKLMPYQIDGVKFLEQSNARAILADEQGLGKTVQVGALLKLHPELLPAVFVTKTKLKVQTAFEMKRWTGLEKVQPIFSNGEIAVPGMDIYIVSYDICKNDNVFEFVRKDIKTVFIDECQWIKDHLRARAKGVQRLCKDVEHIIPMSGTVIKNNAGEYFTALNLVRPRIFPEFRPFIRDWCDSIETNWGYKVGGLSQEERFHDLTKDFILRRTKSEVLPDLPVLSRNFHHVELNPKFNKAYAQAMKELEKIYYADKPEMEHILAIYSRMRKITGLSKVSEAVEFVSDHVVSTNRKIAVFVHHHDVRDLLEIKLKEWLEPLGYKPPAMFSAGSDPSVAIEFEKDERKVIICSTLAAGEGLNLQYISDAVMLERQWNPANEEQAEARFHRFGQLNPVTVTYMLASETIDELFTKIVEEKRAIMASTLDGKSVNWNQSNLMMELAGALVSKGAQWRF